MTFDSDSHFTLKALSLLEQIGNTSLRELRAYKKPLQSVTGVDISIDSSIEILIKWVQGCGSLHPTWRNFFWVLKEIKLNHIADQIEALFSGMAVDQAATSDLDVSSESEETEGREEDHKQEQGEEDE